MEIKHTKHDNFWLYVTGMKMWTAPTLPYGIHLDRMLHEVKKRINVQGPNILIQRRDLEDTNGHTILDREICI